MAKITNPALSSKAQSFTDPGQGLAYYIAQLWKTIVIVGSLAFLLFFIWGGIQWLTAGSDKQKVADAQQKITNAFIGLALLVISFAIILFIQAVFKIDILKPAFPNLL